MRDGIGDRAFPFETDVAIAGLHRQPGHDHAAHAGSVKIELGIAEPIGKKLSARHHLGAHHVAVEGIGPLPVGDMDDAVVEFDGKGHWRLLNEVRNYVSERFLIVELFAKMEAMSRRPWRTRTISTASS